MNKRYPIDSDASRRELIVNAKQSFREAQRTRTWEEKVASIARMNAATTHVRVANKSLHSAIFLWKPSK